LEIKFYMGTAIKKLTTLENLTIAEQKMKIADFIRIKMFLPYVQEMANRKLKPILILDGLRYNDVSVEFIIRFTVALLLINKINLLKDVTIVSENKDFIYKIQTCIETCMFDKFLEQKVKPIIIQLKEMMY